MRLPRREDPSTPQAAAYAQAPAAPQKVSWREGRYCVVDLELTGLDPRRDEIVSFGAVPIDGGRVATQDAVHGLVAPSRPLPPTSVLVHGIRTADLAGAPPLEHALGPLLQAMAGRTPIAHAAGIERGFLRGALRRVGVRLREPFIDTRVLGQLWLLLRDGEVRGGPSLSELAQTLGLPTHRAHDALGDALTTAQVFLALATHLDAREPETVRSLARASERVENLRLYPHMRC